MKNKIDLSKINVRKTATRWITANFDGESKKYEIRALNDGEKINLLSLLANSKDVYRIRNLYVCLLSCGLEIEQNIASSLYDNCNAEALRVGDMIYELSEIFEETKAEEADAAEKNSPAETEASPE